MKTKNELLQALRVLKHPKPCQEALDWIQTHPAKTVNDLVASCDKTHWLCWVTERLKRPQFESWAKTTDGHSVYMTAFMAYVYAPTQLYYENLNKKMLQELKAIWLG